MLIMEASMPDTTAVAAPDHPASKVIRLPGGNSVSHERPPAITMARPNGLKVVGGSEWPEFNQALMESTLATLAKYNPETVSLRIAATTAALAAFKPTDEIEAMIAAQCVALHHASMECFRRAVIPGQTSDVASKLRKDGANLARAMTEMLVALDRKRGKGGQQVVRVEHVHVHRGGQAIVGHVEACDTAAVTKPAPPLAIGQDAPGFTMDDLISKQPEPVGREECDRKT
jgi:hypothetical protein